MFDDVVSGIVLWINLVAEELIFDAEMEFNVAVDIDRLRLYP